MNKVNYILFATVSFIYFFNLWKRRKNKKKRNFEKEILNLENAVEFAIRKNGE